jgi:hypothetical protein
MDGDEALDGFADAVASIEAAVTDLLNRNVDEVAIAVSLVGHAVEFCTQKLSRDERVRLLHRLHQGLL